MQATSNMTEIQNKVIEVKREPITLIQNYIVSVIHQLETCEYVTDDELDMDDLAITLDEDLPEGDEDSRQAFIDDILRLTQIFTKKIGHKRMRIQLEIIRTDMCRLFHADHIRQRLLCTYYGPGTEWLDPENTNFDGLGKGCNENIVIDSSLIKRANRFDVLLLKGAKFEGICKATIHRSPPIEQANQVRVLLKIDEDLYYN